MKKHFDPKLENCPAQVCATPGTPSSHRGTPSCPRIPRTAPIPRTATEHRPPIWAAVTCAQAWLLLGRSPTSPPVMLYLWRRTAGVTPRWNDALANCRSFLASALLTALCSVGNRCSPPTAAEPRGMGEAIRAQSARKAGHSPWALHHCPHVYKGRPTAGLGEPSPAAPAPGKSLLCLPTAEPWSQRGTPCTFRGTITGSHVTGIQEGGLSPQKQLHLSSAAAPPQGGTYRSPGAQQALRGQCRAAGTAPGCAGPACTGETRPRGAGARPGCNTGTATVGWDWTRTQEQPLHDGTVERHRDSHNRATRAHSSPWAHLAGR